MKKIMMVLTVILVPFLMVLSVSRNLGAESTDELLKLFSSEVEGIHQGIDDIAEVIGDALEGDEFREAALLKATDMIEERADTLVELGEKYHQEWRDEAVKIGEYCDDLETELEEHEFDEMIAAFSRIPVSLNSLEMQYPQYLQDRLERLTEQLERTITEEQTDCDDLELTVEALITHSRQLNFAADAVGKKIWKKFTSQAWGICMELDEAVEAENGAEAKALLEELEEPLDMLSKLVK